MAGLCSSCRAGASVRASSLRKSFIGVGGASKQAVAKNNRAPRSITNSRVVAIRKLGAAIGVSVGSFRFRIHSQHKPMFHPIGDLRIKGIKVVLPQVFLEEEMPTSEQAAATVHQARHEICEILGGDRRLLVVAGPCSIHDTQAAREYAGLLSGAIAEFSKELRIVMRVYFEKPRTTVGWKGLINDPLLDQSYKINDGLRRARRLLLALAEMGVPAGTEFLDMITPQYLAGLVSWGAIGARTTESQVHRQLVSGLSCPVGFKNATSGDVQIAVEAVLSAAQPHTFLGHTKHGQSAIFATTGNPDCHVILRGGRNAVNYTPEAVADTCGKLEK